MLVVLLHLEFYFALCARFFCRIDLFGIYVIMFVTVLSSLLKVSLRGFIHELIQTLFLRSGAVFIFNIYLKFYCHTSVLVELINLLLVKGGICTLSLGKKMLGCGSEVIIWTLPLTVEVGTF